MAFQVAPPVTRPGGWPEPTTGGSVGSTGGGGVVVGTVGGGIGGTVTGGADVVGTVGVGRAGAAEPFPATDRTGRSPDRRASEVAMFTWVSGPRPVGASWSRRIRTVKTPGAVIAFSG